MPTNETPSKPATLPAIPVGLALFDLPPNTGYRAANRGELVTGLPVIRAGGRALRVATAVVETVIGRPLTVQDLDAIERHANELAQQRRDRHSNDAA